MCAKKNCLKLTKIETKINYNSHQKFWVFSSQLNLSWFSLFHKQINHLKLLLVHPLKDLWKNRTVNIWGRIITFIFCPEKLGKCEIVRNFWSRAFFCCHEYDFFQYCSQFSLKFQKKKNAQTLKGKTYYILQFPIRNWWFNNGAVEMINNTFHKTIIQSFFIEHLRHMIHHGYV